tara:strand:+ start:41 stop:343 length:303 start_codon:yes stop_codon:yes gene_type:complete
MNNKEILNKAPEGATHWDFNEHMRWGHITDWQFYNEDTKVWENTCDVESNIRALADIKRIEELKKALEELLDATSDLDDEYPYIAVAEGKARRVLEEGDK